MGLPVQDQPMAEDQKIKIGLVISIFLAMVPIWVIHFPPLIDLPMHIARIHILANKQDGSGINEFFLADWRAIPNLGIDLLGTFLCKFFPAIVAGKLVLSLASILIISGGHALARSFKNHSWLVITWPIGCVFSLWFLMGFVNFLLGIGVMMWIIWLWKVRLEANSKILLPIIGILFFGLLITHLLAFLLCAFAIFSLAKSDWMARVNPKVWPVAIAAIFLGIDLGLYLLHKTPISVESRLSALCQLHQLVPILMAGIALILTADSIHPLKPLIWVCVLAPIIGPSFVAGTAFASDRLSIVALMLSLTLQVKEKFITFIAFASILSASLGLLQMFVIRNEQIVEDLRAIESRSTLASFDIGLRNGSMLDYQRHVPDWIILEKSVFVAQNFAKQGQQPIKFADKCIPWHEYQKNNPVEKISYDEVRAELPHLKALQSDLNAWNRKSGLPETKLYVLVFHPETEKNTVLRWEGVTEIASRQTYSLFLLK